MTDDTLLDAVDKLTKPVVLARFAGTDHDHDWLDLERPTTREERDEAKKQKRKLGKTVKTGEYWCPWCDLVVTEKPSDEIEQTINRQDEPSLLDQLQDRISTSLGDMGTKGANTGGSPIDIAAFNQRQKIDKALREWMEELGARPGKGLTPAQLLRSWYTLRLAGVDPVGEDDYYRNILEGWRTAILDILDPPKQIPYMGQACPLCGDTRAIKNVEGDVEDTVALWAFLRPAYREEGSYGICKACDTILARDADPVRLRQKMNGTLKTGKIGFTHSSETGEDERIPS